MTGMNLENTVLSDRIQSQTTQALGSSDMKCPEQANPQSQKENQ
jgi:hypothetical protein